MFHFFILKKKNKCFSANLFREENVFCYKKWFSLVKRVLFIFSGFSFFDQKRLFLNINKFSVTTCKKSLFKKERFLQKKEKRFFQTGGFEKGFCFFSKVPFFFNKGFFFKRFLFFFFQRFFFFFSEGFFFKGCFFFFQCFFRKSFFSSGFFSEACLFFFFGVFFSSACFSIFFF